MKKLAKDLAGLIGISRKETDLDTLAAALAEGREQIEVATRDREAAEGAYRDRILDATPAELEKLQAAKARATVDLDRSEALVAALTSRIAYVRDDQQQAGRRARYQNAQALAQAAQQALAQDYPDIARRVHSLLRTVAEAEAAVIEANAELPDGAAPIRSPERAVRDAARLPLDMSTAEVDLWSTVGNIEPLPEADQSRVRAIRGNSDHGTIDRDGRDIPCVRVTYRRDVVLYDDAGQSLPPLAAGISLPALYAGTTAFWSAAHATERSPAQILAEIAQIEPQASPSWRKPVAEPIPHRFTYWPVATPLDPDPAAGLSEAERAPGGGFMLQGAA
ncbi:hypothetical protein [Methylobacterium sp. CM6246]